MSDPNVVVARNTDKAPVSDLYSQTVAFSHYNNITMQLPLDPGTGRPILGDVAAQTAQCLANVKAILTSVDVPFDDIVKVTIFVKNLADASVVDDVYKTFFPDSGIARAVNYLPARTVVPVKDLPYHCDVAVEAVVSHGDGPPPQAIEDRHGLIIEACNTDAAPKCPLATQSVAFSHYNNISAQLPLDLSGKLIDGTVAEQTAQCLAYVKAIVESVDHAVEDIVKVNVYLADIADLAAMNEAYAAFFGDHKPTLGAGNSFYEELGVNVQEGTAEGFYNLYTTPYLIWTNDAAKAVLGRSDIGTGPTISPCYLMSVLFDCCGWEGPSWMQLQRQTRAVLPVMQSRGMYLVAQGSAPTASQGIALLTYTLSGDALQAKQNYAIAEYYVRRIHPTQS